MSELQITILLLLVMSFSATVLLFILNVEYKRIKHISFIKKILSSDYDETWGLVVNEAMVCCLPAIVSDRVGCGPDLVEEGITGSLYPFGDIQTLAARMLYMAENQERLLQMGKNAQRRVLQHYNVKKAVKGTLAAVEDVTGQAIS
ncbi:MAG: hypothetical protein DSY58_02595 [Desulfobulbus sp.]|nr:MAG: hypothetical protein DSY58_02595 [Desulfobulbus sp.]